MAPRMEPVDCCGAVTRTGGNCRNPRGHRTDHVGFGRCYLHAGAAPNGRKAAEKERIMTEIGKLIAAEQIEADDPLAALAEAQRRAQTMARVLEGMVSDLEVLWVGNQPHVAFDLLDQWNDRSARISKLAIDAGLEERQVALSERQGQMLADVLRALLEAIHTALVAAGAPEPVVRQVWAGEVPGIVRKALSESSGDTVTPLRAP